MEYWSWKRDKCPRTGLSWRVVTLRPLPSTAPKHTTHTEGLQSPHGIARVKVYLFGTLASNFLSPFTFLSLTHTHTQLVEILLCVPARISSTIKEIWSGKTSVGSKLFCCVLRDNLAPDQGSPTRTGSQQSGITPRESAGGLRKGVRDNR